MFSQLNQVVLEAKLNQTTRESKGEQVVKMLTSEWNRTPSPVYLYDQKLYKHNLQLYNACTNNVL